VRDADENEAELPPDVLPGADEFLKGLAPPPTAGEGDTQGPAMMTLQAIAQYWGDYSLRCKRNDAGGLGNAALAAAGTDEQKAKWGGLLLSMAITEPGCGSDPSRVETTAVLDEETDEWVINGEKIFVTTGIRATGVVIWATIDKSAGRAGIKSFLVEKGAPGFDVPGKEKKLGIRCDDTASYLFRDCRIPRGNLLGGDESIPKSSSGGFRGVMKTFNMTRPMTAAMGLGIAKAALDFTREELGKAGVEIDYGVNPARQTAAAERFTRLEALYEAAELTTLRATWLAGKGWKCRL
jgi:acyl-CoA dehydrogenase